jgi:D-alanine-D-alanine ligase
MNRRTHTILLLAGGDSAERDVSLSSSRGIAAALRENGHRVLVVDPARPDVAPTEYDDAIFGDAKIGAAPPRIDPDVYRARAEFVKLLAQVASFKVDVVFNGLHGGAGEDGTVQAVLEYLGIPFTGSGAAGSAFAMDKQRAKILAADAGVLVPAGLHVERSALHTGTLEQQVRETVGLPAVVKPNAQGSSVGLTIVHDFADLDAAAQLAFESDRSILIEHYIEGREITQAILEDGPDLPVLEIRPKSGVYDYFHKYQSGNTEYLVPAPIEANVARDVLDSARRAFAAMKLSVYSRFDYRLDPSGRPWLLEANTLPGMTATSLVPKAAAVVGMSYNDLCDFIVKKALER